MAQIDQDLADRAQFGELLAQGQFDRPRTIEEYRAISKLRRRIRGDLHRVTGGDLSASADAINKAQVSEFREADDGPTRHFPWGCAPQAVSRAPIFPHSGSLLRTALSIFFLVVVLAVQGVLIYRGFPGVRSFVSGGEQSSDIPRDVVVEKTPVLDEECANFGSALAGSPSAPDCTGHSVTPPPELLVPSISSGKETALQSAVSSAAAIRAKLFPFPSLDRSTKPPPATYLAAPWWARLAIAVIAAALWRRYRDRHSPSKVDPSEVDALMQRIAETDAAREAAERERAAAAAAGVPFDVTAEARTARAKRAARLGRRPRPLSEVHAANDAPDGGTEQKLSNTRHGPPSVGGPSTSLHPRDRSAAWHAAAAAAACDETAFEVADPTVNDGDERVSQSNRSSTSVAAALSMREPPAEAFSDPDRHLATLLGNLPPPKRGDSLGGSGRVSSSSRAARREGWATASALEAATEAAARGVSSPRLIAEARSILERLSKATASGPSVPRAVSEK